MNGKSARYYTVSGICSTNLWMCIQSGKQLTEDQKVNPDITISLHFNLELLLVSRFNCQQKN